MVKKDGKYEYKFSKEPFLFALLTLLFATPFFVLILIASLYLLANVFISEIVASRDTLLVSVGIAKIIGISFFCCMIGIIAILPIKGFFSISWLYKGKVVILEDSIEIFGNDRKVTIPYSSIKYIAKRPGTQSPNSRDKESWLLLVWKGESKITSFRFYKNWFRKGNYEEINSILSGKTGYTTDIKTIRKLFKDLQLDRITFAWLFKSWNRIENGVTS